MKMLAIDTSTDYLSVAVMDGERVASRIHRKAPRSHSSLLMPAIDSALKKARLKIFDIGGFAVSVGPGSFTGLRIGVATVKGLAFAMKKRVVAVPTMDVIAAASVGIHGIICIVLDARKDKVYACIYCSDGKRVKRLSRYLLLPLKELLEGLKKYKDVKFIGDFAERAASKLPCSIVPVSSWHPKPEVVGRLGLERFRKKRFVKVENLEPLYLYSRECDITGK
ncbi:MAG: tRNA (adenosine(37)-N6)-threonylcarbamoyltransferase complex dimerization subunit type 1 TsaB [Candidatus Omnitrophica bacterium]|nr:tRNA (adenosine(37)-N6)-threonylcarbamoyltransferase complex dimerization subunit type 1 TsaB [Candidatus Omnitrophota bacterium]